MCGFVTRSLFDRPLKSRVASLSTSQKFREAAMDETDITDWPSCKLGKKLSNLERSLRCLICRDMYENPQMLNCGHSYCSLCIRQHLDQTLNPNNSKTCPDVSKPKFYWLLRTRSSKLMLPQFIFSAKKKAKFAT